MMGLMGMAQVIATIALASGASEEEKRHGGGLTLMLTQHKRISHS